jgi:hypothetical protein
MHLLDDPDLISLVSENPSLGRVLRPICHMLRIPLPTHLQRPQKPRKLRPPRPKSERKSTRKPERKPPLTLLEHLLQKYPPAPPRPTLPGHRYAPALPFKNRP